MKSLPWHQLAWVCAFGVAFAFVESAVVVYLRALSYPTGFRFPLTQMDPLHATVEVVRELATIIMLVSVAMLAGQRAWERFGLFLVGFGVWDLFYYVWLKVLLDWPVRITDWDVLFLIPLPWIGPVIAPALIALLMVVFGADLVRRIRGERPFRPSPLAWALALAGSALLILSFLVEAGTVLRGGMPSSYHYEMLLVGVFLCLAAYALSCRSSNPPREKG